MRQQLFFIGIILSIVFCSWITDSNNQLNANSWNISVGKTVLLASWKNNKMGDVAIFDKTKFKSTDTLFAEQFLCGLFGEPAMTTLTIKNQQNEIIKKTVRKGFAGFIPLSELIILNDFKSGQVLGVYVTVDMEDDKDVPKPVLLGSLKIK